MIDITYIPIILIVLIAFYASLKDLRYGFWAIVIASPLVHKELFSVSGIWDLLPVRLITIGVSLGGLYYLTKWARSVGREEVFTRTLKFIKDPFLILLALLWALRSTWTFKSAVPEDSLMLFAFYTSIILIYLIFKHLYEKYEYDFIIKTLKIYLGLGVLTGVFAVIQYSLRICCHKSIGGVWVIPGYPPRLGSSFWDVNHYGGFLVTIIPLLFAGIFLVKPWKWRIVSILMTGFLGGLLFFTQSRSSWIGLAIGMFISLIVYYYARLKQPLKLVLIGVIVGIIGLLTFTTVKQISIKQEIADYMHFRLDSTDTHVLLIEGATQIFTNNFLVGAGYGNFDPAFRSTPISDIYFNREPRLKEQKVPPHSVWGEVLAETGAVGITLYFLLMVIVAASLIAAILTRKSHEKRYVGIGLLGGLLSILISGIFYSYNMEFFWIFIFLTIGYSVTSVTPKWRFKDVWSWWYVRDIVPYLIIVPPALFYIFIRLGSTTLIDWDEAIYAKVSKNIILTGDWLSLHWDDLKFYWFEKPPLYMWMSAAIFKLTGFASFGARLPSAVFGFLGVIATYKFGRRMYNKLTGVAAALMLLSTIHYLLYSRNGMLDVTVTYFVVASIYFFYVGTEKLLASKNGAKEFALAGLMVGLGVMTKAVVGLIPLPIAVIYILYLSLTRQKGARSRIFIQGYFAVLIVFATGYLVAAPWHIYSLLIHGEKFWDKYFIDHILDRGLSGLGHEQPWNWFLVVIKTSFRIWVLPLLAGIALLPFVDKKRDQLVLLFTSSIFILALFSVSKDKLQWYIMPIYPFISIIAARFIDRALVFVNSAVRRDLKVNYATLRTLGILSVSIVAVFYVVLMRDRVYYPDANQDKVAMLNIFNAMYPYEDHPDKKLYFINAVTPVILFYSDHKVVNEGEDDMMDIINDAGPNESNMFLINDEVYYHLLGRGEDVTGPYAITPKGTAGGWVLVKSESRVSILRGEFNTLNTVIPPLEAKQTAGTITMEELVQLDTMRQRYTELYQQLSDYGYPPF